MYYSSEGSDSENIRDNLSLDFSYLTLDSQALSLHLKNSVFEQNICKDKKFFNRESKETKSNSKEKLKVCIVKTGKYDEDKQQQTELLDNITEKLYLQHNLAQVLPFELTLFTQLKFLDLSNNNLYQLNEFLPCLIHLQTLYIRNNELVDDSFPKDLSTLNKLKELNMSGNNLTRVPPQIYQILSLKFLYIGNNHLVELHPDIKNLQNLQILQLGGNKLETVPDELGLLKQLGVLALCDNKLKKLPRAIANLAMLKSLLIHKNNLCCLPSEIVTLRSLKEISLRDNPLVNKFVDCCAKEIIHTPPSLLELAARVIKLKEVAYEKGDIPAVLDNYINSGKKCVNPTCKGMYFTACVEHVKFVDFCGMYRLPLMHYLCSTRCSSRTPSSYSSRRDSESDEDEASHALKKILLG